MDNVNCSPQSIIDPSNVALAVMAEALAACMAPILRKEIAKLNRSVVQPMLLDVKQAAVYLGRTEQSIQHLIFARELPVVRVGRRVHLHRTDLDDWIEKNKF